MSKSPVILSRPTHRFFRAGSVALLVLALMGCSKPLVQFPVTNAKPTVRITAAPIDTTVDCRPDAVRSCYSLTLQWVGYDPDGRVDHYLFAIDPPDGTFADTVWNVSRGNQERLTFAARKEVPHRRNELPISRDFHVFVIKAVDNVGQSGPTVSRAFFSFTQAPDVFLVSPLPSHLSEPLLVPSVRFTWTGSDADGVFHDKPVKYKYILLNESSAFPIDSAIANPDRFRARFAPDFSEWDSVGGDTTSVQYTNLVPNQRYLFAVVGFDEAGAYSAIWNLDTNMLRFRVGFTGVLGPKITMFNEFFNYTWRGEECPSCPSSVVAIEIPAGKKVLFSWFADPPVGASVRCYRWAIDIEDIHDETPRRDDNTDLAHWSTCGINVNTIALGPYAGTLFPNPPERHRLYVECRDDLGLRGLAMVDFTVVRASLTPGTTLVVKDTRLKPDFTGRGSLCADRPLSGVIWPNQAELDTFLFARGGVPYRCMAPAITVPGLFAGYPFDTIGTRIRRTDLTVRLSKLAKYEHVVWIVDAEGASDGGDGQSDQSPQTALRYMTGPGRFNTLGAYVKQGGKVWLLGGGAGYAAMIGFTRHDDPGPPTFTYPRELGPGRFMYDLVRWQTEFTCPSLPSGPTRYAGRFRDRPGSGPSDYTRHLAELPALLEYKSRATDPPPPTRPTGRDFYLNSSVSEFLTVENQIIENVSDDPEHPREESALDTLYAEGGPRPQEDRRILMTYYHGPVVPQGLVFSGFDIWKWKRSHCQAVVDFVLTRIWDLPRPARTPAMATR